MIIRLGRTTGAAFYSTMCALPGAQNYKIGLVREGNCNLTRTQAATELVNWQATEPTGVGDLDVLIMGDLNFYAREDLLPLIKMPVTSI